jgi:hypothetical protein
MKGAREFADLFHSCQYGRLYVQIGSHARGKTLHIFVLPDGVDVGQRSIYQVPDVVEVYGIVSGQPGWTEEYGWLHEGKWQGDFFALVESRKAEIEMQRIAKENHTKEQDDAQRKRIAQLLENYA